MAILIENMEMPKSCDSCRIMEFEDTNCVAEFYCGCPIVFQAHPQGVDHRPDYCPLIEVPEPHGRLIDADKLVDSFEPSDFWNSDAEDNCFAAVRIVHSASTVIPASKERM